MADAYYGQGGSGYYTDPATGRRYYQTRYAQGADAYDPQYESRLIYDPNNVASDGTGSPNNGAVFPAGELATNNTGVPLSDAQKSAKGILNAALSQYGLGSLSEKAWGMYLNGDSMDQIMLELRATPEYKARFPGMDALAKKGRAISEGEYISTERQMIQNGREFGLPDQFVKDHLAGWIGDEVSASEQRGRFELWRTEMYQRPPQVRDELQRLYGLKEGDILALVMDEKKALPIIQNQFLAAEAGYAANASGYGALTRNEAETLGYANRSFDQLTQGFDQLAREGQLFNPIVGEAGGDTIDRQTQLDAQFGGNTAAQRRIEQTARRRAAQFQGGGSYSATPQGVTGLGSAAS